MRVIFLTTALGTGGAETQMLLIARGLAATGIRCTVISLREAAPQGRLEKLVESSRATGVDFRVGVGAVGFIRIGIRYLPSLLLRRCIVWTWGYRMEAIRLVFCPFSKGVFSIRSASESQLFRWRRLLRFGRFFTWRYISNSELGVTLADRVAPGIASKAKVVPNALDASNLRDVAPLGDRPPVLTVLMLGNVRYKVKGYDIAIDVGRRIRDAKLPIRICIGGKQLADECSLQKEIQDAGVGEIVRWAGPIIEPAEFLRGGHAFLLLSRYEGMPNALFEAMAVSLPCIATEVGDLRRYADESKGLKVIPIADAEAAFQELVWIWQNWHEAVAMGKRSQRLCLERFSEDRMIDAVREALALPQIWRQPRNNL